MPTTPKKPKKGYGAGKYGKRRYGHAKKPKRVTPLGKKLRRG